MSSQYQYLLNVLSNPRKVDCKQAKKVDQCSLNVLSISMTPQYKFIEILLRTSGTLDWKQRAHWWEIENVQSRSWCWEDIEQILRDHWWNIDKPQYSLWSPQVLLHPIVYIDWQLKNVDWPTCSLWVRKRSSSDPIVDALASAVPVTQLKVFRNWVGGWERRALLSVCQSVRGPSPLRRGVKWSLRQATCGFRGRR